MPNQELKGLLDALRNNNFEEINKKYKQDNITSAYKYVQNNLQEFDSAAEQFISDLHISKIVGTIKRRSLNYAEIEGWEKGVSDSHLVKKSVEGGDPNAQKFINIWIQKSLGPDAPDPSEHVCEYIGSNMMRLLRHENSPKFRIYADDQNITVTSKFIPRFESFNKKNAAAKEKLIKEGKGFANFLASSIICGDYDLHGDNVGSRTDENGELHWAGIDHGRALSYFMKMDFNPPKSLTPIQDPNSAKDFIAGMDRNIYPKELFKGLNFACELANELNHIDEDKLKKVATASLDALKRAYGEKFLENIEIENNLREKLGIGRNKPLSIETIEEEIINNIKRLKDELQ
ncbi:MAG: hypothetical protein AABY27_03480, partial [Pseudomonadota bacterium]